MKSVSFRAPWGSPLVLMTGICLIVCLVAPIVGLRSIPGNLAWLRWPVIIVPLLLVLVSACYMVRGYILTDDTLVIKRLGWNSKINLADLSSATVDPEAFRRSIRVFGNGGFFSFVGWFRNAKLGVFRAYATDSARAVVLRVAGKTIVITPDDPQKFVAELKLV